MTTAADAAEAAAGAAEAAAEAAEEAAETESAPPTEVVVVEAEPAPVEEATGALQFADAIRAIVREEIFTAEQRITGYIDSRVSGAERVATEAATAAGEAADAAEAVAEEVIEGEAPPPPPAEEADNSSEESPPEHPWFRKRGRRS